MDNSKFTDNQDIFDLDINKLVSSLLAPVDAIRSQTETDGFIESRVNAFYRMIGFPVANNGSEFYSPGYDINANIDNSVKKEKDKIADSIIKNKQFVSQQLDPREQIVKDYSREFSNNGFNAKAIALGSVYVRSFEKQFSSTEPLALDPGQVQPADQRKKELSKFYGPNPEQVSLLDDLKKTKLLSSNHYLKPFIVDPRINVYPDTNIVAAPFLLDASELKIFSSSFYKRPYIERVISIRLNNANTTNTSVNISNIIEEIKNDNNVIDKVLLGIAYSPEKQLQNSDITVFNNYFKIIRALVNNLIKNIKEINDIRSQINFQPVPDPRRGMEGDVTIEGVERDPNNKEKENNILDLYAKVSLGSFAFASDLGLQGQVDEGSFVFSGIDDMVFSAEKAVDTSLQDQLDGLLSDRQSKGLTAAEELKSIEYIMGEFSGLGLIDIVAIQSALWLMDKEKLVGLIDTAAYERMKKRKSINSNGISRDPDVLACLKEFELKLKDVYTLTQLYFDQVFNGKVYSSS